MKIKREAGLHLKTPYCRSMKRAMAGVSIGKGQYREVRAHDLHVVEEHDADE